MTSLDLAPFDCPTLQNLNVDESSIDAQSPLEQATKWLSAFEASLAKQDLDSLIPLFHEHGFWKDILTLTWDFRTIRGHPAIQRMLEARLAFTGLSAFYLLEDTVRGPVVLRPLPDLVFIRFCFDFETMHGKGNAVAFLVPTLNGVWKAWSLLTCLSALKAYPEKIGVLRARLAGHDDWQERRRREINFEDGDPTVLVIGAGHSGLDIAARLTYLGVPTLVIDRNKRVGDNWRKHYHTLRLHNPVWFNQMPYLDYPKTFPVFCPAPKVADWLESYATSLDLNVWLSSSITSTCFSQEEKTWQVSIDTDGKTRSMKVRHLVFATGLGGGSPKMPDVPGKESYHGIVLHSTQFTSATEYRGKKVIVVGTGNSAHDIAHELYHHGCKVTMIQRSPTYVMSRAALAASLEGMIVHRSVVNFHPNDQMPLSHAVISERYNEHSSVDFADFLSVALPYPTQKCLWKASTVRRANGMDKEILDNLVTVGFRTWLGPDGAGLMPLVFERAGGFYIDTGTCSEIIDGSIKVKNTPSLSRFTEEGIEIEDGTILEGGVVVFATGFGDIRSSIGEVCGPDVAAKVGKVWGLDAEGELQGLWRRTGHPRLWAAISNFSRSRFHSLHLALQIKAIEEGIIQDSGIYTV